MLKYSTEQSVIHLRNQFFWKKNFVHDDLPKSTKAHNNKSHPSSKLTPKVAEIKTIEKIIKNFRDIRNKS